MKYFILFSCFAVVSIASATTSTEIIFHRKNHLGFEKTDSILLDGKSSYVNALSLTKIPVPKLKQLTERILSFKAPPQDACVAGEFELTIKRDGHSTRQQGCMGGEVYADLVVSVEDLKSLARGKK